MAEVPGDDPFDLQRFLDAQAPVMGRVLGELKTGQKQSHWMWFVFPQIDGLGSSPMAQRYALSGEAEALAYWRHEVLGKRLDDCVEAVLPHAVSKTPRQIFGTPDDLKFHSSLTIFEHATGGEGPFGTALEVFFAGRRDNATLSLL